MNIKQFLKPDWRKILITVVIMIVFFPGHPPYYKGGGFPLCYLCSGNCYGGSNIASCGITEKPINLILDIIIWYLISCLIIWIYDKFKKKPQ
jgi:hypothetical protein